MALVKAQKTICPLPRQWKSNIPKEVATKKILSLLSSEDLQVVAKAGSKSNQGHCIDAVGLGLYALGLRPFSTFPH